MTIKVANVKHIAGFTLIELVVVLIILLVLVVSVVPRWIGSTPSLYAQTQQLLSDIRYTQSLAMTRGQRYRVNLVSPNSYTISDINGNIVLNPSTGTSAITLENLVTFGSFTNLPNSLIAFDERGIPYTNSTATVALTTTAAIPLTAGGMTKTISISPETGRAIAQ